jgi:glycosyltransferase involved in cell wall biosynthesis
MANALHFSDAAPKIDSATCPLRVMFVQTVMPIGGAEMLTVELIRRLDRRRFAPELCCLKQPGPLGEWLADEIPVHHDLLSSKYDLRVLPRLVRLLRARRIDAVVTVGAGDKMFWGRLAARRAGVPVILSALHSTGWPDGVGRLNRWLTPLTDAFVAVAPSHGRFLVEHERFPRNRVVVIPNGVDTNRFAPMPDAGSVRDELGISPTAPVVTIVAALRPEKNHELFLDMAVRVRRKLPDARFLIVGDGPRRPALEERARELGLGSTVLFLGSREDVPQILSSSHVFALTSYNEANPVSILEAMSVGRPVVATNVGSIREVVDEGVTGLLVSAGNAARFSERVTKLLCDPLRGQAMGDAGRRKVIERYSVHQMVRGYEWLIEWLHTRKTRSAKPQAVRGDAPRQMSGWN